MTESSPPTNADRGTDDRRLASRGLVRPDPWERGTSSVPDFGRAGPLMRMTETLRRAERVQAQERLERGLDALEPEFEKRLGEFERRLPSIAGGAKARLLHEAHQDSTRSKPPRNGIGYGVEWVDKAATDLAFGYTPDPKKPNPTKDREWEAYRDQISERLKKNGLKEVSCITVPKESLQGYTDMQGLLETSSKRLELQQILRDVIAKAENARGPGVTGAKEVYGGRVTVILEELRKKLGFQTTFIDALPAGAEAGYWNKDNYTSYTAARKARTVPAKKADVYGAVDHKIIDTRVTLDQYVKLGKNMSGKSRDLWEAILRAEYGVGVTDSGYHTFAISKGMVYEIHWDKGPTDPSLSEVSSLKRFFKDGGGDWGSAVIALPPSEKRAAGSRGRVSR